MPTENAVGTAFSHTISADMHIDDGSKYLHWFDVDVTDGEDDTVARVRRQVYYRRKR